MAAPLEGITVLEVGGYAALPSSAALLSDMGAQVIKVEPLEGDPYRYINRNEDFGYEFEINYGMELDNRGKRSITLNLGVPQGRNLVRLLCKQADVFMTNILPNRLEKLTLTYEELANENPRLIYVTFSAHGSHGPEKDRPGYDFTSFWARSGMMSLLHDGKNSPPHCLSAMGDHTSAMVLLAGVLAALLYREKTGEGEKIECSLLNTGLWVIADDIQEAMIAKRPPRRRKRHQALNPLNNLYKTRDGRWLYLVMFPTDQNWIKACKALGLEDLWSNPRYKTMQDRSACSQEIIQEFDKTFKSVDLNEVAARLNDHNITWSPMVSLQEIIKDEHIWANQFFINIDHPSLGSYPTINTPIRFHNATVGPRRTAPELGQHTEEILLEQGLSWNDITDLRNQGVIL